MFLIRILMPCLLWQARLYCAASGLSTMDTSVENGHYVNEWAVRIPGGAEHADLVARENGYENIGQLKGLQDIYLMRKYEVPRRSKRHAVHHTLQLNEDIRVEWAEQQIAKPREKRAIYIYGSRAKSRSRPRYSRRNNANEEAVSPYSFNDPQYPKQWYLHDTRAYCSLPALDMNVESAWAMGITGEGVHVSILDDGLEWNHTDIVRNYDPYSSYDVNGNDSDPFPRYDSQGTNKHGTRCAGEVAMVANNKKCGVGVAYNAKIGGVRLLDGSVTDAVEAMSVGYNCTHVDIYSSSWGPTDNGETLDGPGRMTRRKMEECIIEGRNGLGSLYIWASGNGGGKGDNCDCDGYTSSIYTISIGGVSEYGKFPWYGEMCASTMACTNSGGAYLDQKISTVDLHNECTDNHSGTSAAAPLAAGAFALVLQANSMLTWRDCQHILVCTAEMRQILDNPGWQRNGVGYHYNQRFGFGLINAERMVKAAQIWENVPEKTSCNIYPVPMKNWVMSSPGKIVLQFQVTQCTGSDNQFVNWLEHVEVTLDMSCSRRGAIDVQLISGNGTESQLLNPRAADKSTRCFQHWTFMSVHMWGENPRGLWTLIISDNTGEGNTATVNDVVLTLHGTQQIPPYRRRGISCGEPRKDATGRSCREESQFSKIKRLIGSTLRQIMDYALRY